MTALQAHLPGVRMQPHEGALSPFGYLLSALGGLAAGIGAAFLIWHLI
jgi:hypothetical protein